MAYNYTELWEAFIGGEFGTDVAPVTGDLSTDIWESRTAQFYTDVVGPAFGQGEAFTEDFEDYIASFELGAMERAEAEFRMSIGDPYGGTATGDPFSWEKISRYTPQGAQTLLTEELFEYGEQLGGEVGATFGTGMAKGLESYTSGLEGQRQGLTYTQLEGSQGLASGTSGAVLRSGEAISQSEDVLVEAYEKSKSLGLDYMEGKVGIQDKLESNLEDALSTYIDAIDDEKENWYNSILDDVMRRTDLKSRIEAEEGFEVYEGDVEWGCGIGLKSSTTTSTDENGVETTTTECIPLAEGDEGYEEAAVDYAFREDGACGIGEVWAEDPDNPGEFGCQIHKDLNLQYDSFGRLCENDDGTAKPVDECGVCGGDGSSCWDCNKVPNGDAVEDVCGQCVQPGEECVQDECGNWGGDGISEGACDCDGNVEDCAGECGGNAEVDECGECQGDNSSCTDECGVINGDNSSCTDCAGTPNGDAEYDACGECGGTQTDESLCGKVPTGEKGGFITREPEEEELLEEDCAGVIGGDAEDLGCGCGEAEPSFRCTDGSIACNMQECMEYAGAETTGCTDCNCANYDPSADYDDGSCTSCSLPPRGSISGCLYAGGGELVEPDPECADPEAKNYNPHSYRNTDCEYTMVAEFRDWIGGFF